MYKLYIRKNSRAGRSRQVSEQFRKTKGLSFSSNNTPYMNWIPSRMEAVGGGNTGKGGGQMYCMTPPWRIRVKVSKIKSEDYDEQTSLVRFLLWLQLGYRYSGHLHCLPHKVQSTQHLRKNIYKKSMSGLRINLRG